METLQTSNSNDANQKTNAFSEISQNELFANANENDFVLNTAITPITWQTNSPLYPFNGQSTTITANSMYDESDCYISTYGNSSKHIAYTNLNGFEEVIMLKKEDIVKMSRKKKTTIALSKKFPFFSIKTIEYTEVLCINDANPNKPITFNALECPSRIAKRLGISYEKANSLDLVDDDLLDN